MIRINRRHALHMGSLALLAAACPPAVRARGRYPERPVRVLVASAPGGVGDVVIRLLAPRLEQTLGQKLIIDAKPGVAASLAMLETVRTEADGYTLLVGVTSNFVINQFLTKLPFDPLAALTPIAKIAEVPIVFFSNPSVPARNFGAFIAHARANPGKLNYGSPGTGSVNHLLTRRLEEESGIVITHVPYRSTPTAMLALLANDIQLFPIAAMLGAAHLAEGRLTAFAVTTGRRMPLLPDVPSVVEAGLPRLALSNWRAMAAPAGTPEPIISLLERAVAEALNDAVVAQRFSALGLIVPTQTREQFTASLKREAETWSQVIKRGKITME